MVRSDMIHCLTLSRALILPSGLARQGDTLELVLSS